MKSLAGCCCCCGFSRFEERKYLSIDIHDLSAPVDLFLDLFGWVLTSGAVTARGCPPYDYNFTIIVRVESQTSWQRLIIERQGEFASRNV